MITHAGVDPDLDTKVFARQVQSVEHVSGPSTAKSDPGEYPKCNVPKEGTVHMLTQRGMHIPMSRLPRVRTPVLAIMS